VFATCLLQRQGLLKSLFSLMKAAESVNLFLIFSSDLDVVCRDFVLFRQLATSAQAHELLHVLPFAGSLSLM
jgi:hypothetical protein